MSGRQYVPTTRLPARRVRLAAAMAVVAAVCLSAPMVLLLVAGDRAGAVGSIGLGEGLALVVPWLAFSIVGTIIVDHVPDNAVGWLCSIAGLEVSFVALSVGVATVLLAADPSSIAGTRVAWLAHTGSITIVVAPLLILYRFPTGRPLGPWWHRAEQATLLVVALMVLIAAIDPSRLLTFPGTQNPFGVGEETRMTSVTFAPVVVCAVLAVLSLVVRFRQGSARERRQVAVLALAAILVMLAMTTMTLTSPQLLDGGRLTTTTAVVNAIAFTAIPVAIGIAIVRDHLYEIDRIVNRTIVYAVVSAVLAGTYVAAVLGLSAVLATVAPESRSTLATAGSTLLVAALFRPVRARAQRLTDRRFDRERYEAARSVDAFAGLLRGETGLDAIASDLQRVAGRTVHPSAIGCWIRETEER